MLKKEEDLKSKRIKKKPKKPNGFEKKPTKPKKADKDNEDEEDDDIDNEEDIKKKKRKRRKTFEDVFLENQFSENLEIAIRDFIDMRKTMKKPMTTKALELLIKNLEKLTNLEEEKIAIINQSIEHSWQTVYPLKQIKEQSKSVGRMNDFKELWEEARYEQTGNNTSNNAFGW